MAYIARCDDYSIDKLMIADIWQDFPNVDGKSVFVKPNMVTPPTRWDKQSTTRVEVLEAVLKRLRNGLAEKVIVGCCGFKDQWNYSMELSKYPEVCEKYGADLICVQEGENFHKYTMRRFNDKSDYLSLFGTKVSDFVLNSDIVINIPKLKVHNMAFITCCIKNMMGVISPKGSMHPGANADILHKRLRDLYKLLNPIVTWNLVDGIVGAEYSEQFGVGKQANVLISGTDMWEVDWYAAQAMGINPADVPYLKYILDTVPGKIMPHPIAGEYVTEFEKPLTMRKHI